MKETISSLIIVLWALLATTVEADQPVLDKQYEAKSNNSLLDHNELNKSQPAQAPANELKIGLEPRISDHHFVRDIIDRLHALDADIGKLLYNSTSMYAPNDANDIAQDTSKGGEKFTEVLNDLDALQDEIGVLVTNATRSRQYNILVRLRPLNNLLYRIRHNLHLMRNSLVAINTVSSLEKIGNSVLDSTLSAFMRPDANLNDELGDTGNYDINLDKLGDVPATSPSTTPSTTISTTPSTTTTTPLKASNSPGRRTNTTPSTTTTTTTKTTTSTTTAVPQLANLSSTEQSATTRRAQQPQRSQQTRRPNQRNNIQRRQTTSKPSTTSTSTPAASRASE